MLCRQVLSRSPANFDVLHRGAILEFQLGRPAQSLQLIERVLVGNPRSGHAINGRGLILHALGQHAQALAESARGATACLFVPRWRGANPLAGETILPWAEQGLGDTLQFCHYARFVAVQPELKSLLSCLAGLAQILAQGGIAARPRLSLPAVDLAGGVQVHARRDSGRRGRYHPPTMRNGETGRPLSPV